MRACFHLLLSAGVAENSFSAFSALVLGLVLGLKHAVEADHLAAVSTIVSERKNLLSASLVGGMWGVGHTLALLLAGVAVIFLRLQISPQTALRLELLVALMLVALGANALWKLLRGARVHFHAHHHGRRLHAHPHLHNAPHHDDHERAASSSPHAHPRAAAHTHHNFSLNARPLAVGMIHGLAGSAALMLLVLSNIDSPLLGLLYIAVFGAGSIGGMMLMSALVGLPVHLTGGRWAGVNQVMRGAAGLFSFGFGLFMVYEIWMS